MTNSTNNRIRKYAAGGIISVAAMFGGALGSAGVGFAAPADGLDPIAPAVEAPAPAPTPALRAPAAAAPAAPAAPAVAAPAPAPALRAPAAAAPAAPAAPARSAGKDHKGGSDHGRSSKGRSH